MTDDGAKFYLGDGVYARTDKWGDTIVLSTQRERGWEELYLEPAVWAALLQWVEARSDQSEQEPETTLAPEN